MSLFITCANQREYVSLVPKLTCSLFFELEQQPELKSRLYDNYPIIQQGDGYILFDLRNKP
jgi:hypothetical protein